MPILAAQQVSCEKQDRVLFQDIDLSIHSGELVFLRGENGAGKTSLLRILVGLSKPTTGEIIINDQSVADDIHVATSKLVYVGHKPGLSGLLTPVENLAFYLSMNGQGVSNSTAILETLSMLGLDGVEDLPLKNLSAGQQRRVCLAKLWLNSTANLWVLDEPFTALDVATVALLEAHIDAFLEKGGAVIMTSHQTTSIHHPSTLFDLEYAW